MDFRNYGDHIATKPHCKLVRNEVNSLAQKIPYFGVKDWPADLQSNFLVQTAQSSSLSIVTGTR